MDERISGNAARLKRRRSQDYKHGSPVVVLEGKFTPRRAKSPVAPDPDRHCAHGAAMRALEHFDWYADSSFMALVVQHIARSDARREVIDWFKRHAEVRWNSATNCFRGSRPAAGINLAKAQLDRFTKLRSANGGSAVRVDHLWSKPLTASGRCHVCGQPTLPGEMTCYSHHNK